MPPFLILNTMVVLNECRIDQEGKNLIIEATVNNLSYYKDVFIDSVIVDTNSTYSANGPSNNPVFKQSFEPSHFKIVSEEGCVVTEDECVICPNEDAGVKHIRLVISAKEMGVNIDDHIFFVYIITTGYPTMDTPCGMDNSYTMAVAVNLRPIYNLAMSYIKEVDSNCEVPKGFIDMILRLKALEMALKTGNYTTAFKYWDRLFKNKKSVSPKKGCGCNGAN